ncbi:MAG: carboxypeptidase regulatory-like domain-containing protein [Candidatus Sumerlaeia bacterium]|nr:carboxypeptidase regulatory-like domain-containing protein [Candidatus Sumerlaeia bacterium]
MSDFSKSITLLVALAFLVAGCGQQESDPAPERTIVYRTAPTASVAGEIAVEAGVTAYGILVYAEGTSYIAMTDEDGRFELSGLPEGDIRLRAQRFDLEPYDFGTISIGDDDLAKVQPFRNLPRAMMDNASSPAAAAGIAGTTNGDPGTIRGSVRTVVPGDQAGVTITVDRTSFSTRTDANGQFELAEIPPGSYSVVFERSGYQTRRVPAQVLPGANTLLQDIRMEPAEIARDAGRTIFGRVDLYLADGSLPTDFSNVRVVLEGTSYAAYPDGQGRFEIRNVPSGSYTVSASAPNFLLEQKFTVDLASVSAAEVDLLLVEDDISLLQGELFGTVLLEGAEEGGHAGTTVAVAGTSHSATTDSNGDFIIAGIEPGQYMVTMNQTGYKRQSIQGVNIEESSEVDLGIITLELDVEAPKVVMTVPSDGDRSVSINQPTRALVQFSMNMDARSVIDAISVSPEVQFKVEPEGSGRSTDTFVIEFSGVGRDGGRSLRYNTQYTVTIAKSASNMDNVGMEDDYVFRFRTGRPEIIATAPSDGSRNVSFDHLEPVRIYFNAPIDPRSIDTRNFEFRPRLFGNPNMRWQTDDRTGWSILILEGRGEHDTEYRVRITGSARTVAGDRVGNLPYSFSFRTFPLREFEGDNNSRDQRLRSQQSERERR